MTKTTHVLAASAIALGLFTAAAQAACTLQIPFASGSSAISSTSAAYLARVAQEYPASRVAVSGHTDAVGDASANEALSNSRIDAVLDALRGNGGSPDVVARTAQGETNLAVQSNGSQAANRRVDLSVEPCDPTIFADLGATPVQGTLPTQNVLVGNAGIGGVSTGVVVLGLVGLAALLGGSSSDGT